VHCTKRILVVEEDAEIRADLAERLESAGLGVDVAADGADGIERLRSGAPPSVILLDLRRPRLGGEEFLRAMRADVRFEHIPVITMSAGADPRNGHDLISHLTKPFDFDDLLRIVVSLAEASAA